MPASMNSKNAAMTKEPAKAARAAKRSGAARLAWNEYTTAMGARKRKLRNMGRLDGRELSPLSMKAQANAATSSRTTAAQPRIGARRDMPDVANPTPRATNPSN